MIIRDPDSDVKPLCDWCENKRHVHDVNSGRCIHANLGCECEST